MINFEDSLWDLLLGTIFIFLAIYPITRELLGPEWNIALFLGSLGLLVVGLLVIRYFISAPRIGYVRPRSSRNLRLLAIFNVIMVLLTFSLLLITFLGPGSEPVPSAVAETSSARTYTVELITLLVMGGIFSAWDTSLAFPGCTSMAG